MPCRILEIEVLEPFPSVTLTEQETGLAVVVRLQGQPVGFWLERLTSGTHLEPAAIATPIDREVGSQLLAEKLKDEVNLTFPTSPLPALTVAIWLTVAICTRD